MRCFRHSITPPLWPSTYQTYRKWDNCHGTTPGDRSHGLARWPKHWPKRSLSNTEEVIQNLLQETFLTFQIEFEHSVPIAALMKI